MGTDTPAQKGSPVEALASVKDQAIDPELFNKIEEAFQVLEDLIHTSFPKSRIAAQVLTFLEIAALYVGKLLVK